LRPASVRARTTEEDEHLFDLLRRAYIEARYKKSYRITAEELAILGAREGSGRAGGAGMQGEDRELHGRIGFSIR
jgi:hypothetical protein